MRRRLWDFLGKWLVYRGNANTMFALAGKRHGWQRKGGPVMMRSTSPLSFRKSTVVASIRVWGGQSFLRGFYGSLRYEPCTQFINVSQRTLHIYFIDGCRHITSKQRLVSKLPDRCFRFDFAWLVTLNLVWQAYYYPESAFRNLSSIFIEESMKTF